MLAISLVVKEKWYLEIAMYQYKKSKLIGTNILLWNAPPNLQGDF